MSIGVTKIKIPFRADELTLDKVRPYLQYILTEFEKNKSKITKNYETYLGKHDVLSKVRPYDSDLINHRIVEPHLYSMVDFKCGYALGNPKEYAQREGFEGEDIIYLNKYWKDAEKLSILITKLLSNCSVNLLTLVQRFIRHTLEKNPCATLSALLSRK